MRHYRPQDRPELPFEIAKVATADDADIVRFARQWGLLGYYTLWLDTPSSQRQPRELSGPGDPVDWIRGHARDLALCISLVDGLAREDHRGLVRALMSYLGPVMDEPSKRDLASRPSDWARYTLSVRVNEQIKRIWPALQMDGTISFQYTAMIEIAYVHVARLAGESMQIDRCEECGAPFKKVHGLQRFCPPGQFESASRCSYRQRYRRFKSKEERKP